MGKRILLLSKGRTCCHLLERMLSQQPNTAYLSHPWISCRFQQIPIIEQGPLEKSDPARQDKFMEASEEGWEKTEEFFAKAEKDHKTAFLHFHPHFSLRPALASDYIYSDKGATSRSWDTAASNPSHHYTNVTTLPDELFLDPDTICVLTTRDPALMVPSAFRGMTNADVGDNSEPLHRLSVTYRFQVMLYDWLCKNLPSDRQPIVIDACDYSADVASTKRFMDVLCARIGLDAESVIYSWPKAPAEQLEAMPANFRAIMKTLLGSDGFVEGQAVKRDVPDGSVEGYQREFGEEKGKFVWSLVEEQRPFWEYLHGKRLKVEG